MWKKYSAMRYYFYAVFLSLVLIEGLYFSLKYYVNEYASVTYYVTRYNSIEKYKTFDFDRADWTVRIKKGEVDMKSDPALNSLLNEGLFSFLFFS